MGSVRSGLRGFQGVDSRKSARPRFIFVIGGRGAGSGGWLDGAMLDSGRPTDSTGHKDAVDSRGGMETHGENPRK